MLSASFVTRRRITLLGAALLGGGLCSTCSTPPPTEEEIPSIEATASVEELIEEPSPILTPLPPGSQRIEFETPDGITLVGLFYPACEVPAPAVILLHGQTSRKEEWRLVIGPLQGHLDETGGVDPTQSTIPSPSYNVFIFDFRGHGESGRDETALYHTGWLLDAYTALDLVRTLPGVIPDRIVLVGSSMGADAAVDVCGGLGLPDEYDWLASTARESCVGAMAFSPGGWLRIPYTVAANYMWGKPLHCVACDEDDWAVATCLDEEAIFHQDGYEVTIYSGPYHGSEVFFRITDQEPLPIDLLLDWLQSILEE